MDSQEQPLNEDSQEQPKVVDTNEQPLNEDSESELLVTLPDGTQISQEEAAQGYLRQADYTRKTKELSLKNDQLDADRTGFVRNQSQIEEKILDPEVEVAAKVLKTAGFVTQEDLKNQQAAIDDDRRLQRILDANPDIAEKEDAIRAIGKTDNRAWEDIIDDYGFKKRDKISKARASKDVPSKPASKEEPKLKSVKDMTTAEYEAWKKDNLSNQTF